MNNLQYQNCDAIVKPPKISSKKLLELRVSHFKNYLSKIPDKDVNLFDWLQSKEHQKEIEKLRTITNKEERNKIKAMLPCITPSGLFSERKVDGLIVHSGYICLDIDAKENPAVSNFNELKAEIKNIVNIAYCGLSVSGNGLFCILPIKHPEKHKQHFEALKMCFESLNIIIDKSCADVSRLRGCTYDDHPYFNTDAIEFDRTLDFSKSVKKSNNHKRTGKQVNKRLDEGKNPLMRIISKIEETQTDITGDYHQWFQIGCALANELGEEGRELFHVVSSQSNSYKEHKTDNQYSSCLEHAYDYSIGTFFHWAAEAGIV